MIENKTNKTNQVKVETKIQAQRKEKRRDPNHAVSKTLILLSYWKLPYEGAFFIFVKHR